ncbi:hypothetical protein EJB05_30755, partial [Eragrostis curvula]
MILERHSEEVNGNLLMILWRVWSIWKGVLKAGEVISIEGSDEFLKRYMAALLQIRQQEPVPDVKGKGSLFRSKKSSVPRDNVVDKRWVPPDQTVLQIIMTMVQVQLLLGLSSETVQDGHCCQHGMFSFTEGMQKRLRLQHSQKESNLQLNSKIATPNKLRSPGIQNYMFQGIN